MSPASENSAEITQHVTRKRYRVTVEDVPDEAWSPRLYDILRALTICHRTIGRTIRDPRRRTVTTTVLRLHHLEVHSLPTTSAQTLAVLLGTSGNNPALLALGLRLLAPLTLTTILALGPPALLLRIKIPMLRRLAATDRGMENQTGPWKARTTTRSRPRSR